jgi:hypothetical protein
MDYNLRVLQTDRVTESDSLVLSQVKAGAVVRGIKKPVIFTADKGMGMAYNAGTLGIRARKPTPKTPPVPPLPTLPQAKVVNIKNSAKIASAWKATAIGIAIGGAIGGALIGVAAYFLQKGQNKENEKRIADGFSRLRAEIQRYAATRTRAILDEAVLKAPDGKVYVVAEVEILSSHANTPALTPQAAGMVPPSPEAVNSVKLHAIYISSDKREGAAETKQPFGVIVQETYRYQYVSSDVTPPKDLIMDYNTSRQYLEYNKALLKYPELSAAGRVEIKNIINRLDEQMDQLGTMDKFSPNPNLWTDEGLTRFPD